MSYEAVGSETTAPSETPVDIDRSFFLDPSITEKDKREEGFENFVGWISRNHNCANQPHPEGPLSEEDGYVHHFDLLNIKYRERIEETHGPIHVRDTLERQIVQLFEYDELEKILQLSFNYWLGRLNGVEFEHQDFWTFLKSCDIPSYNLSYADERSIYGRMRDEPDLTGLEPPEKELYNRLIEAEEVVNKSFNARKNDETWSDEVSPTIRQYFSDYELRNVAVGIAHEDICPEQEMIILAAIYPLLYLLEYEYEALSEYNRRPSIANENIQKLAVAAKYIFGKYAYFNAPDLSLRLDDIATAILDPAKYGRYVAEVVDSFNEKDHSQILYQKDYLSVPLYTLRNQFGITISRFFSTQGMRDFSVIVESPNEPDEVFTLSLHGNRMIVGAGKGIKFMDKGMIRTDQKSSSSNMLADLAAKSDELSLQLQLLNTEDIPNLDAQGGAESIGLPVDDPDMTLKEYIKMFRLIGMDFSGVRFELVGMEKLPTKLALKLYSSLIYMLDQIGLRVVGLSSIYGNDIWEALHMPIWYDLRRLPLEKRMIHYRNIHGHLLHSSPMVVNVVSEAQIATSTSLSRNEKSKEARKRAKTLIVKPVRNPFGNDDLEELPLPFYYVIGMSKEGLNLFDAAGRVIEDVLSEPKKKKKRKPEEMTVQGIRRQVFALGILQAAYDLYQKNPSNQDYYLSKEFYSTLPYFTPTNFTFHECLRLVHEILPFVTDSTARRGLLSLIETRASKPHPIFIPAIHLEVDPTIDQNLAKVLQMKDGSSEFAIVGSGITYLAPGIKTSVKETDSEKLEYKMIVDLCLYVTSVLRRDIPLSRLTYYEDEVFQVNDHIIISARSGVEKINNLISDQICTVEELTHYIKIAYSLLNNHRLLSEEGTKQGVSSFRRNPTNLMTDLTTSRHKFRNLRERLVDEVLNHHLFNHAF